MRLLITGVCGFVGSRVARALRQSHPDWSIGGFDNFSRPGSRINAPILEQRGISVWEQDLRARDLSRRLPESDWVIDCAANPSVLAGLSDASPSMEVMDHNLIGTLHLLEYCKSHRCGLILVSTSRVYGSNLLAQLPVEVDRERFRPMASSLQAMQRPDSPWWGLTERGISERFSTRPPLSLYGASKLASELLAAEYASAFEFPLQINRCGVMAGAGQFGKPDQGIVAYWIHSWFEGKPLRYVGFDGLGRQVRDCLHPDDLTRLIERQIEVRQAERESAPCGSSICNVSGGLESAFSLRELTEWCEARWPGRRAQSASVVSEFRSRPYDAPWIVLDSHLAQSEWEWQPTWSRESIWDEIARHAEEHPHWLDICCG